MSGETWAKWQEDLIARLNKSDVVCNRQLTAEYYFAPADDTHRSSEGILFKTHYGRDAYVISKENYRAYFTSIAEPALSREESLKRATLKIIKFLDAEP